MATVAVAKSDELWICWYYYPDPTRLTIGDDEQDLTVLDASERGAFTMQARVPLGVSYGVQPISPSTPAEHLPPPRSSERTADSMRVLSAD